MKKLWEKKELDCYQQIEFVTADEENPRSNPVNSFYVKEKINGVWYDPLNKDLVLKVKKK